MRITYDNLTISSFLLWVDNKLTKDGVGYTNTSSLFYPVNQTFNGYYTYASPFKQIVYDSSAGATVMTGVYLNNTFITTGQSGLAQIDYNNGRLYFTGQLSNPRISGDFAIKDFNVHLTTENEVKLLLETKFEVRPRNGVVPTGLESNQFTYPCIYIKQSESHNEPYFLGGTRCTKQTMLAYILADSDFKMQAVKSIFRDQCEAYIPILSAENQPFNQYGGLKSGSFNYTGAGVGKIDIGSGIFVRNVYTADLNARRFVDFKDLNPEVFKGLAEFELEHVRF
jgi:hypothetical protein